MVSCILEEINACSGFWFWLLGDKKCRITCLMALNVCVINYFSTYTVGLLYVPFVVAENDVNGELFVGLTEESLRIDFPKLTFGQRKECLKLIKIIQQSKEKYVFSKDSSNNDSIQIFDISEIKSMTPQELSLFLQQNCSAISAETIVYLLSMFTAL